MPTQFTHPFADYRFDPQASRSLPPADHTWDSLLHLYHDKSIPELWEMVSHLLFLREYAADLGRVADVRFFESKREELKKFLNRYLVDSLETLEQRSHERI